MEIDEKTNVTGVSEGRFETLDLTSLLYVGGLPNFNVIKNRTGFTNGFMGKIFIFSNCPLTSKVIY